MNSISGIGSRTRAGKTPARAISPIKVSPQTLGGLTQVFKLLSDESRLRILLALAQEGEMHVSAMCALLAQSQPAISHHLTLLRMTGLVGYRRSGKHNYYRIESGLIRDLLEDFFAGAGNGHKQLQFDDFSIAYKRK